MAMSALGRGLIGAAQGYLGGLQQQWQGNMAAQAEAAQTERLIQAKAIESQQLAALEAAKDERDFKQEVELQKMKNEGAAARGGAGSVKVLGPGAKAGRINPETGAWEELASNEFKPSNLGFQAINLPDGSTVQGQVDPLTGRITDLAGNEISPAIRSAPRGSATRTVPSAEGGTDIVTALEAELGRKLTSAERGQVESGTFDIPATGVPEGLGRGQSPGEKKRQEEEAEMAAGKKAKTPAAENAYLVFEQMDAMLDGGLNTGPVAGSSMAGIPVGKLWDYDRKAQFEMLVAQASPMLRTIFRIPGEGAISDSEQKQYGLTLPGIDKPESVNRAAIANLRSFLANSVPQVSRPQAASSPAPAPTGFRVIGVR